MPMYSDKTNAENKIRIIEENRLSIKCGPDKAVTALADRIQGDAAARNITVAIDAWYGTPVREFAAVLEDELTARGISVKSVGTSGIFITGDEMAAYKQKYITDDPGFGYVNSDTRMEDIVVPEKLNLLVSELTASDAQVKIIYGEGAMMKQLCPLSDIKCFMDITREPMLWKMWDGKLIPFGSDEPRSDYYWKEYYYCDFYLLHYQKKYALTVMDYYIEGIEYDTIKLVPRAAYDEMMQTLVKYPIKQVKEFQPGPWGAYRYRDLFNVPGLGCNAWNRLASPELSVLIDVGADEFIDVPLTSLMQYGRELCGDYLNEKYPDLFPLEIWLDDGYFPEKQPAERISMPVHNHPSSAYVKEHFNEPLGRYETYYIAEAYEGANTWMGFTEDCDLEKWEELCRDSENEKVIPDWKDYIANHTSNEGDLYLIPPGTVHCHGGNQMVLEMDTCPSIAGTEYSFFEYDFARPTWDDEKQTMTAKRMKMHIEHAFDNEKWRRDDYVRSHHRATRKVTKWTKEYWRDEYSSLPEMPFKVERMHFYNRAEDTTDGKYVKILTLTVGTKVRIISKNDPSLYTLINRFQSAIVPASFGDYEVINDDGGNSTIVEFSWKKVE
nr:hypothetical protein [Clostridia bacterium]